jgi:sec-independent protein translocase protein TatA
MFGLGVSELIIIGVIILLIFGARRLPEIGRGLGQTAKEIKNISKDIKGRDKKEEKSAENQTPESSSRDATSESTSVKGGIDSIPGVEEIKTVSETASQVRKWWRFLKH